MYSVTLQTIVEKQNIVILSRIVGRELMLKVDNIILVWRFVIPNMVSESCP